MTIMGKERDAKDLETPKNLVCVHSCSRDSLRMAHTCFCHELLLETVVHSSCSRRCDLLLDGLQACA